MALRGGRVQVGPDLLSHGSSGTPSGLAQFAGTWIEMGAQIVGGCCATGPEHIMATKKPRTETGLNGKDGVKLALVSLAFPRTNAH